MACIVDAGIGRADGTIVTFSIALATAGNRRIRTRTIITAVRGTGIPIIAARILGAAVGDGIVLAGVVYA